MQLLHLGCGDLVGANWKNVDGSPNVIVDNFPLIRRVLAPILPESSKKMKFKGVSFLDLRRRWPFDSSSFDGIYSSHVFEHLGFADGQHVLRECFRCLKPRGRIRFLLPSIADEVEEYLKLKRVGNPLAATEFARITNVFDTPPKGSWWYRLLFAMYNKNSHKMFYDAESLIHYFTAAGFESVARRNYHDSTLPHLDEVEKQERFAGSVCIEGERPDSGRAIRTGT